MLVDEEADFLGACLYAYAQGASSEHRRVLTFAAVQSGLDDTDAATRLFVSACQGLLEQPLPNGLSELSPLRQGSFLVWLASILFDVDASTEAQVLHEVGLHYMMVGERPLFARQALRRALSLRLNKGDSWSRTIDSMTQLAVAYDALGRHDRALRLLRLAHRLSDTQAIEPRPHDACLRLLSAACAWEGDLHTAIECHDAAEPLAEAVYGASWQQVDIAWTVAICRQAFRPEGTRASLVDVMIIALKDLREGRAPIKRFTDVDGLPHALARTPHARLSLLASRLTVRLAETLPDLQLSVEDRRIVMNNHGNALLHAGWNERAIPVFAAAAASADGDLAPGDRQAAEYQRLHALGGIGFAHYNLAFERGSAAERYAERERAADAFDAADDLRRRVGSQAWFEGRIWSCAALIDIYLGRRDAAWRRFAMALLAGRKNWSTAPNAAALGMFFNPDSGVHEKLTEALELLDARHAAVIFGKAALHAVHRESVPEVDVPLSRRYVRMRSDVHRLLVRCLTAVGRYNEAEQAFALLKDDAWGLYVRSTDVPIEVESGVALTRAETAGLERSGLLAVAAALAARAEADETAIDELAAALVQLDGSIAAEVAAFKARRDKSSARAHRLPLAASDARLRYVVSPSATSITIETLNGFTVKEVPVSFDELSGLAFALRQAGRASDALPSDAAADAARRLGRWLIEPVLDRMQGVDHLWIEVDNPLDGVPFAALLAEERMLISRCSIAYLNPSGPAQDTIATAPTREVAIAVFACSELPGARLPGAAAEAEAIACAAVRGTHPVRVELHDHAHSTVARFVEQLQQPCQRSGAIHLATHAEFNATNDALSVLALSDGNLSVRRLRRALDAAGLDVGLFVLSACGTARQDMDVEGFSATLLRAGAGAVVSSLWETLDVGAPAFFSAFYTACDDFGSPRQVARALRQAQLALAGSQHGIGTLEHLALWAPYVVTSRRVA